MRAREGVVELVSFRCDRQLAARGHRVARVDGEVDDRLGKLPRVGHDRWHAGTDLRPQRHIVSEQTLEHAPEADDRFVHVEDARLEQLFPAEGEQLSGDGRGPFGGTPDLLDVQARGVIGGHLAEGELRIAADCRQRVVEVVRDAAREPADGFELLRLAQLFFELPTVRAVLHGADHANRSAGRVADDVGARLNPADRSVAADDAIFELESAGTRGVLIDRRFHATAIIGVHEIEERSGRAVERTRRNAEDVVRLVRPAYAVRVVELGDPAADVCDFLRLLEKRAVLVERPLRAGGLADVTEARYQADDFRPDAMRRDEPLEDASIRELERVEYFA